MPTLHQRLDGGFIILTSRRDNHHTWQCSAEGARCLQRRGVSVGASFGRQLLHELFERGLVFTDRSGSVRSKGALPDVLVDPVGALHTALVKRDVAAVEGRVIRLQDRADQLALRVSDGPRLRKWKAKDSFIRTSTLDSGDQLTVAFVTMNLTFDRTHEVNQTWLHLSGAWRLVWETLISGLSS